MINLIIIFFFLSLEVSNFKLIYHGICLILMQSSTSFFTFCHNILNNLI